MKHILLIMLAIFIFSCEKKTEYESAVVEASKPLRAVTTVKIVKAKNQAEETSYEYKYDWMNSKFRQQPNVKTVFYIVYKSGDYEAVDVGKYSNTNVGDTIVTTTYQ